MTTAASSTQASEQAISAQFASRPTLQDTVWQLLSQAILEKYPGIELHPELTTVGIPIGRDRLMTRALMEYVQDFLGTGKEPDFPEGFDTSPRLVTDYLIIKTSPIGAPSTYPDMALIKQLIVELPWTLNAALQNNLAAYWGEPSDTSASRWQWLSDRLRDNLQICAIEQAGLNDFERATLDQVARYPNLEERRQLYGESAVHGYCPELVFAHGTTKTRQLSPALLLVRSTPGQTCVLLCAPSGTCERFASMDAFIHTWGSRMAANYEVAQVTINRYEPDGNIFDSHAASLLNQQLENLQSLIIPADLGFAQLAQLHTQITEPGFYFLNSSRTSHPVLTTLRGQLPDWLQQASAADRITYRHYSLALASAKKRSHGRTFLSDIPDIRTFTNAALLEQLTLDQARLGGEHAQPFDATQLNPEDLQLKFIKAAGLPNTVGVVERSEMSLTDLAIHNLVAQPGTLQAIEHRNGLPLPGWLNPAYIISSDGLIRQVDIGKTYPQMLEKRLLGQATDIAEREASFADQTAAQLALTALELKLRRRNGLTEQGVRYVHALLRDNAQERQVNGRMVVIRQLALVRKPGAHADLVTNMFIIEAQDIKTGPHLLYRPLYDPPLQEFVSRAQLLQALAQPGALQTSVLMWLSDKARPIYDNGGFIQPHYVRFGSGSDFAVIDIPPPPTLATEDTHSELQLFLLNGDLMKYLYGSNARALVSQANRDSVSNAQSRWAVFMEGATLAFSTLLMPVLRGPAMLTGWLLTLMNSARNDIPALNSADPVTRELAWVDLLLNVGMLLLQHPSATAQLPEVLGEDIQARGLKSPMPRRDPAQWPLPKPPELRDGTVALDADALRTYDGPFDFSFSNARERLTPSQQTRLSRLTVPQPENLPPAVSSGPSKGLYEIHGNWFAEVEGHWYRVQTRPDGEVIIVFPSDSGLQGPALKSDGSGRWSLDLRLRLRGGMPRSRIEAARQLNAQRKVLLDTQFKQMLEDQEKLQRDVDSANLARERNNTAAARRAFDDALDRQTQRYVEVLDTVKERCDLRIPMAPKTVATFLGNTIKNARKSSHMASEDRLELVAAHSLFFREGAQVLPLILANKDRYARFTQQLIKINQRQIQALERQDRYLQELTELGPAGAESYLSLTHDRADEITVLGVKYLQLQSLKFSLFKNLTDFPDELSDILDPLGPQVRTHAELKRLALTPNDRLQVLESLNEHYGQAIDALQRQAIVHADTMNMEYFNQIQQLVEDLYQDTARQLANAINPGDQPAARQPTQPMVKPGKPQKKVIKTRKQGTLIGELKTASGSSTGGQVEVRAEQDQKQLLATYTLHDDVWDEVPAAKTGQPTSPAKQPLNVVKAKARKYLSTLDELQLREQRYAQKSRYPVEIEENLQREASRYRALASELERALKVEKQTDEDLLGRLNKAADTLDQKGQELRIDASIKLPPTHANLSYLLEQQKVRVIRLGTRKAMRGPRNDFIEEYVITYERESPLWYAHFHYPNANTPKQDYTVAHLKTVQQRKESYHSLLAKSSGAQSVVDIYRGLIGKPLAQRWFLSVP